ncbi:sarcosine oxidase subunit alpha family protein [Ancylobacter oerskovii]|uniref:Sarcosine oxidase subunit alpha family protein n=1 Tax=Ancylobacter oerskovii TaxID=459519 RepID=A0ABW4YSA9_9HYPH|nr:sarcosine oxidase subunit alpha family protein [Ancylobacter oerskovii]MBS7545259.1 sarcosine oxidase subunit alpha family protein [Ancylobacter oerskovii]
MTAPFRTPSGGRIDRATPLTFRFDGQNYPGYAGDTLASALLANGVHLLGRSFKYHRPRGLLSAGSDEPNALVEVRRDAARVTPNLRATQVELYDGLAAESQNRWPSLARDAGAVNDLFAPFLPAGFYYKTFMWPAGAWKRLYEPKIRAMAGLGKAPTLPDPDRYTQHYAHCDVLVIGAGPAGIAAALAASAAGARTILVDEQAEPGGSLLAAADAMVDTKPATQWLADALAELAAAGVTVMPRTTAFGYFPHNMIALAERVTDHLADPDPRLPRERLWQVRAKEVVIAAGALERPLVFPENDRPGVMLADSARTYLARYGVKPGERAVVFTAGDHGYRAALELAAGGVAIAAIADLRAAPEGDWPARALAAGIDVRPSTVVTGTAGRLRVKAAQLAKVKNGKVGLNETVACDTVLMSGGLTPSVHLFSQSRGKLAWDETLGAYLPGQSAERERSAGACRGRYGLAAALADGYHAGEQAAAEALKSSAAGTAATGSRAFGVVATETGADGFIGAVPHGRNPAFAKAFVDWQNDVTAKDIALATREGMRSIEHVKRYTTTGMATDQGKTSNMNALGIVSEQLGTSVPKIGLTTFRPPFTPTTFGIFAGTARGDLFDPVRVTPIHGWAEARGAVFEPVSLWKRALYFPNRGEDMHAAVARECKAVRSSVGIFDASTLGKIEVVGPDAAEFMNRIYTNAWTKLAPGRLRYGVMLREDGFVMDDGVVGRLSSDRFHVTTTTGGAARVLAHMEDYLQTEWPDLDVWLTSTTEQWAVIAVQGPKSREVLAALVEGIDLSREAMPNMSVAEGRIAGVPTRLFRLSFAGELGFEVNVPAAYGRAVWEAIFKAGEPFGITPYGTETMHVLRAEKGYIIVGQETDGTAGPDDVNLGWAVGKAKKDFVGKRSLNRAAFFLPDRKQLVGLLTRDPAVVLEEGAQVVASPNAPVPVPMLGHVTSSYMSATLGRSIALAMVKGGRARLGQTLQVPMPKGAIPVEVVDPVFYDAEGARLDV